MNTARIREVVKDMRLKTKQVREVVATFSAVSSPSHMEALTAIANKMERWANDLEGALDGKDD